MSKRNLLLLVIAALIAGVTAFAVRNRIQPTAKNEGVLVSKPATRVLVAKRPIKAGSFIKIATDLDWAAVKENEINGMSITDGTESMAGFEGAVARRNFRAGEEVTQGSLVKPGGGGFLSAVLEPGRRAMSIAVTATSGNAGFVAPGDSVDLMVTHKVRVSEIPGGTEQEAVIGETFIENVRVVAVDQKLDNPENKAILAKTVTVEVTPKQAEKIAVAQEIGKVSVVLRSMTETPPADAEGHTDFVSTLTDADKGGFTRDYEVSGALSRSGEAKPRVRVFRGDTAQDFEFYRDVR